MSDVISRQVAISAICSACGKIDCDKMDKCEKLQLPPANCSEFPNSSDTISRQAAIKKILLCENHDMEHDFEFNQGLIVATNAIEELPTSEKRGKWIDGNEGKWNTAYCPKCSVCGTPFYGIETVRYHYCPNCGARMEE